MIVDDIRKITGEMVKDLNFTQYIIKHMTTTNTKYKMEKYRHDYIRDAHRYKTDFRITGGKLFGIHFERVK